MRPKRLTPKLAKSIIKILGSYGIPPQEGLEFFTIGIEDYLQVIDEEYFKTYIKEDGGAAVKVVLAGYGGGKTHFLYCLRDLALKENFVVSYVPLSPSECPFYRLELVYRSVINNLICPDSHLVEDRGLEAFMALWYERIRGSFEAAGMTSEELDIQIESYLNSLQKGIENLSFARAVASAFEALHYGEDQNFHYILQWLKAEGFQRDIHSAFGILSPIDRSNAFVMMRSLVQWIRQIGYSGLVILFDEVEPLASLKGKNKELLLSNLREMIDACVHSSWRHVMLFYALVNESVLEGNSYVYEALKQRIASVFDFFNPSGVKIELERIKPDPIRFMVQIGEKLKDIYEIAYKVKLPDESKGVIDFLAREAYERRFGDVGYLRFFVQSLIKSFGYLRQNPALPREELKKVLQHF